MKYYKSNYNSDYKLLKLKIKALSKKDKRNYKISEILYFVSFFILIAEFVLMFLLIINVKHMTNNQFLKILLIVIFSFLLLILPISLLSFHIYLINHFFKVSNFHNTTYKMMYEANIKIFEYYDLNNNYIITKCYNSSNDSFINKDVLICYNNGKIKITNDLYHSISDIGCYEFDLSEIKYYNFKEDGLIKTKLECEDINFILGYRAKTFIEKRKFNVQ